jgi:hypothetical protein
VLPSIAHAVTPVNAPTKSVNAYLVVVDDDDDDADELLCRRDVCAAASSAVCSRFRFQFDDSSIRLRCTTFAAST